MRYAFEHACRKCGKSFSPPVDLDRLDILTAQCSHCGHAHGYDNRQGALRARVQERLKKGVVPESSKPLLEKHVRETPVEISRSVEKYRAPYTSTYIPAPPDSIETPPTYSSEPTSSSKPARNFLAFQKPSLKKIILAASLCLVLLVSFAAVYQALPVSQEAAAQAIAGLQARHADVVLDREGRELTQLGVSGTEIVPLDVFRDWQIKALLFSEDREFFNHNGVSYSGIFRAALRNIVRLRYAQGASTITQQLARTMLQARQKSILRKLNEIRLARALEAKLTKKQILELYVNHVYLGHGNFSFASAAQFYYAKKVNELSVNEFLSLVALIPSPETFSPIKNNSRLRARMEALYQSLVENNVIQVTADAWERGMETVIQQGERFSTESAFGEKSRVGLWPAQFAREFLADRKLLTGENQNSAKVYTTIDSALQRRAESLVEAHLKQARRQYKGYIQGENTRALKWKTQFSSKLFDAQLLTDLAGIPLEGEPRAELQAALIALNPKTGEILAMVGGDRFDSSNQLNRTVKMRRQTGSAIKPFIYAEAIQRRAVNPVTLVDDTPYVTQSGSRVWAPENINGGFEGPITVRDALAKSRNIPAIRVGRQIGRTGVTDLFSDFFFQSEALMQERFTYDETVAIGTISLSPLEMARAFAVFANAGQLTNPILITRVQTLEKDFNLAKTHPDQLGLLPAKEKRILSPAENAVMVSLLRSSGRSGGTGLTNLIGKTGTSSGSRDLWFVGGGRDIIAAVWFGYDDMRFSIPGATGSALAARLVGDFLREKFQPTPFEMVRGVVRLRVCPLTGKLASATCKHARSEVFLSDATPDGECLHGVEDSQDKFAAVVGDSQFR